MKRLLSAAFRKAAHYMTTTLIETVHRLLGPCNQSLRRAMEPICGWPAFVKGYCKTRWDDVSMPAQVTLFAGIFYLVSGNRLGMISALEQAAVGCWGLVVTLTVLVLLLRIFIAKLTVASTSSAFVSAKGWLGFANSINQGSLGVLVGLILPAILEYCVQHWAQPKVFLHTFGFGVAMLVLLAIAFVFDIAVWWLHDSIQDEQHFPEQFRYWAAAPGADKIFLSLVGIAVLVLALVETSTTWGASLISL